MEIDAVPWFPKADVIRERRGRFVTIFNDLGERYFSTRLWD